MTQENCTYCNNEFDAEGDEEFCSEECRELNQEGEKKMNCEHELNLIDEQWMSQSVIVTAECGKCKAKFGGLLVRK